METKIEGFVIIHQAQGGDCCFIKNKQKKEDKVKSEVVAPRSIVSIVNLNSYLQVAICCTLPVNSDSVLPNKK